MPESANPAMLDGMELARALVAHPGDWEAGLVAYERELFPRSARIAEVSARDLKLFFGPNAPGSVVDLFTPGCTRVRSLEVWQGA